MPRKKLSLTFVLFCLFFLPLIQMPLSNLFLSTGSSVKDISSEQSPKNAATPDLSWWNVSWNYRKTIKVDSLSLPRTDSLFEEWFNFTDILTNEINLTGKTFDNNSIRVIEYDLNALTPIVHNSSATKYPTSKYEVPYSTRYDPAYTAATNARIKISWVLNGTTTAYTNRTYCVYFDIVDNGLKETPNYWIGTGQTYLNENEYIKSSVTTPRITSANLWSISSSNISLYVSNSTSADASLQGQPTRMWYIASGSTISSYRYNYALMDYSQIFLEGATTACNINISKTQYLENKLLIPQAYTSSNYDMNITYEVFENSIFSRVTYSFYAKLATSSFKIQWHGDLSATAATGNDLNTQRSLDSEGYSYEGNGRRINDPDSSPTWVVFDDTTTGHDDLLGFILPDATQSFQFVRNGYYAYDLWGYSPTSMTQGSYYAFSYYLVTTPKGSSSYWSPVEDACTDLVTTPKAYTTFPAEVKTSSIVVDVVDRDGFIVPNAKVYLNASADLTSLANQTTDEAGTCTFNQLGSGQYNFTVTLTSDSGIKKFVTNGSIAQPYLEITNHVILNASIWQIQFNVKDKDNNPLNTGGWISINRSALGPIPLHNLTLVNGAATFRWENDSAWEYNYTVYYASAGYNNGIPLILDSSTITQAAHAKPTIVTINTDLTSVNFTVINDAVPSETISGVIIRVFNSSYEDGTPNTTDVLADLTPTSISGFTQFYWRARVDGSNYSIWLKVGGSFNWFALNTTNGPPWSPSDWTLAEHHYQNFTMTQSLNKTVAVQLQAESTTLNAELVRVNNEFSSIYSGERQTIQVLYYHNTTQGVYGLGDPSVKRFTLREGSNILLGPASLNYTSQTGRYEVTIDTLALGMEVGKTYSVQVEVDEGGYNINPSTLWYWLQVKSLPTSLSADPTWLSTVWGDQANMTLNYTSPFTSEMVYSYTFLNSANQSIYASIPRIRNEWNLTEVRFNSTGTNYDVRISKGGSEITLTNNDPFDVLSGPWSDANLTFFIDNRGGSASIAATCIYARTSIQINQTLLSLTGNSMIDIDIPGWDWKLAGLTVDLLDLSGDLVSAKLNLTAGMYGNNLSIDALHKQFTLDNYFDPQRDSLNLTFSSATTIDFNATLSCLFVPVAKYHSYSDTDVITYAFNSDNGIDKSITVPSDKVWETTEIELDFSGFRDLMSQLVDPNAIALNVTYDGVEYALSGSVGTFGCVISIPVQNDMLAYILSTTDISAYNLTIFQSYRWVNTWNVPGATVSYYVFSNSSITGTALENSTNLGLYNIQYATNRAGLGTQILRVTAIQSSNSHATASTDVTLMINQIPTTVNNTDVFHWSRSIYKTESHIYLVEYYDTHNLCGVTGAIATYIVGYYAPGHESDDSPDSSAPGNFTEISPGIYQLDYDTEFLTEGTYKFSLYFSTANGAYVARTPTLTLRVDLIPGNLTLRTNARLTRTQRAPAVYAFNITDNRASHAGEIYHQADTNVAVEFMPASPTFSTTNISWVNGTLDDGTFNLTIDTRNIPTGEYDLKVTFTRINYTTCFLEITLIITAYHPTLNLPAVDQPVTEGEEAIVQISVIDSLNNSMFTGIQIDWYVEGTGLSGSITTPLSGQSYEIRFATTTLNPETTYRLVVNVSAQVEGVWYHLSQVQDVDVRVQYTTILGMPRPYFWSMMLAIIVLVGVLATYRAVKVARIPKIIKIIDRTTVDIRKQRKLDSIELAQTKDQTYAERLARDWVSVNVPAPWKKTEKSSGKPEPRDVAEVAGDQKPDEVAK